MGSLHLDLEIANFIDFKAMTSASTFRNDINGLRAIAVIAVVLFHFNPSWMAGGFAGVDVFFVISGFLMTGIIFRGIDNNNFSVFSFYVSRANRIVPALAALCLTLMAAGWFILTPLDYKELGKHSIGSIGFISNILYWRESGYFDSASLEKWLLHTWSLSVEWQFYIIYPLAILFINKLFSRSHVKYLVLAGCALSFILCIFVTYKWPTAAYYILPTRAWEMLIGGVAYLFPINADDRKKRILEIIGASLVFFSYLIVSSETAWPGYMASLPVLGAFLIIQSARSKSIITGNFIFQKIGLWSYSIYLWHWPIVVAIYIYSLSSAYIYLGLALSTMLGYLSYEFIEKYKFNSLGKWPEIYKAKPLYIAIFVISSGVFLYKCNGVDVSFRQGASSEKAKFLNIYATQHKNLDDAYWLKCNTYTSLNEKNKYDTDPVCITKNGDGGVFLWGDSHAEALSFGLRTLLHKNNIPFYQKTSAGCSASLSRTKKQTGIFKQACDYSNSLALASIGKIKPTIVIIAQANSHNETDWEEINQKLLSSGVSKVILVGPVPQWRPSLPRVIIKESNWKIASEFITDPGLDASIIKLDRELQALHSNPKIEYISLIKSLCTNESPQGPYFCRVRTENGDLLQVDYGHLSISGSIFVVDSIISKRLMGLYIEAASITKSNDPD